MYLKEYDSKKAENKLIVESSTTIPKIQLDQVQPLKSITYEQVDEITQVQWCKAIVFNNEGKIMAAGCDENIKIWKLQNGKMKSTAKLSGHTHMVSCLVFSKKINWFASGSDDDTIRCWKETRNKWVSSRSQVGDSSISLLLNRDEDQLLSCGFDCLIKVWKVDQNNNLLTYNYKLDKHTSRIYSISLNDSESLLVSCSRDFTIIIWGKGQLRDWEFKYYITSRQEDVGHRISFINDDLIVWQTWKGLIVIFQLINEVFQEMPNLSISLNQNEVFPSNNMFPSIYNKRRDILVQKYNKYVYLIRRQSDGKLKVESSPIYSCHPCSNGGLTNDGQYLVIWNGGIMEFSVYQINYD